MSKRKHLLSDTPLFMVLKQKLDEKKDISIEVSDLECDGITIVILKDTYKPEELDFATNVKFSFANKEDESLEGRFDYQELVEEVFSYAENKKEVQKYRGYSDEISGLIAIFVEGEKLGTWLQVLNSWNDYNQNKKIETKKVPKKLESSNVESKENENLFRAAKAWSQSEKEDLNQKELQDVIHRIRILVNIQKNSERNKLAKEKNVTQGNNPQRECFYQLITKLVGVKFENETEARLFSNSIYDQVWEVVEKKTFSCIS
jgi:hypothetical protein